jgi:hypothetical protein
VRIKWISIYNINPLCSVQCQISQNCFKFHCSISSNRNIRHFWMDFTSHHLLNRSSTELISFRGFHCHVFALKRMEQLKQWILWTNMRIFMPFFLGKIFKMSNRSWAWLWTQKNHFQCPCAEYPHLYEVYFWSFIEIIVFLQAWNKKHIWALVLFISSFWMTSKIIKWPLIKTKYHSNEFCP